MARPATAAEPAQLLEVPFVPQTEALCGGAALAMVMRYWGVQGVRAEDFRSFVRPEAGGIRAVDLEVAARQRGFRAVPFAGALDESRLQLERRRPVIALVREARGLDHYVVIVGIVGERTIVHDPGRGPYRVLESADLDRAWRAAGGWGLLVLPDSGSTSGASPDPDPPRPAASTQKSCDSLVAQGVQCARDGDFDHAEAWLAAAQVSCPESAAPLTELAGVRFLRGRFGEAESLAARATTIAPSDAYAWRLLATTRFMRGESEAALTAWNAAGEPQLDLLRIDGLDRTRYDVVADLLHLPAGSLLTESVLRRSRRRLASLPCRAGGGLSYVPQSQGAAHVDVHLLERPRWSPGPSTLPFAIARGLIEKQARIQIASPTGHGELWTGRVCFGPHRPAVESVVDLPSTAGIWRGQLLWEQQAFAAGPGGFVSLERRRGALGYGQWSTGDLHWNSGVAMQRTSHRGHDAILESGLEVRAAGDRFGLHLRAAQAWNTGSRAPWTSGNALAGWSSGRDVRCLGRIGFAAASAGASPLDWPRAGTESDGTDLLRAHPLLENGVVTGVGFGRRLAHGGVEVQVWPVRTGLVAAGLATFVDVAKAWNTTASPGPHPVLQTDVGLGLRFGLAGHAEQMRIDLAHGLRDGTTAASIGLMVGDRVSK